MKRPLHLYTPYYLSEDFTRQKELDACLKKNLAVEAIDRIFLLVDDGHIPPVTSDKLTIIHTKGRPNYAQWIDMTRQNSGNAISILCNSDIYFDETAQDLQSVFQASDHAFVALTRYEIVGETISMHPNPHWSQDVWAIDGAVTIPDGLLKKLDIPLGVPRCDNKIAYLFSLFGYDIFNPCKFVRTYHLHETQLRSYDSHVDKRILGGTAWVYASEAIETPSRMVFDVWTLQPDPVERVKINNTIVVKEKQGLGTPKRKIDSAIVAYDRNWQFPAITEQHAFERLAEDLHLHSIDNSVKYLAFPWATLLDNLLHNKKDPEKTAFLKQKLLSLKPRLEGAQTVVTVCQHIHMLRFQDLFKEMGVTDIFWSHAVNSQPALPQFPEIALHAFPLFPVQAQGHSSTPPKRKKHLYSFMGAKANQYYLTQSRNIIIEELSKTNTGLITGNDTWHYNKVVYDFQVRGLVDKPDALVDASASNRFREILQTSVFSLCPSGTGPNSIRLWESIGLGAIPVILADDLALPGDPALWQQAAIFCPETREAILELPKKLKALHADGNALKAMRHAMAQIWELYGADNFVYDVRALMLQKTQQNRLQPKSAETILKSVGATGDSKNSGALPRNLTSLTSEILLNPESATQILTRDRAHVTELITQASDVQKDIFMRALAVRNLKETWNNA